MAEAQVDRAVAAAWAYDWPASEREFNLTQTIGISLYYLRRYDEAIEQFNKAQALDPEERRLSWEWLC